MRVGDFDYELPAGLIAQEPSARRDLSRLLVLNRRGGPPEHRIFRDIVTYFRSGDLLVINETKVLPVRLYGRKATGGRVEVLLLHPVGNDRWAALVRPGKRVREGARIDFGAGLSGQVVARTDTGGRVIRFTYAGRFRDILDQIGHVPLPPYIRRKLPPEERERYQTVYARRAGSAAAPTAGLHFTPALFQRLQARGVATAPVLLHIGLDTFRPVQVENISDHRMHSEWYAVPETTARQIKQTKQAGGRVIAVGTTVTRCLEASARSDGTIRPGSGTTDLFIYPGYQFRAIDALITNFHLPRSTLLMLVSAFVGRERLLEAYRIAIRERYRFFSFGDAMFIV